MTGSRRVVGLGQCALDFLGRLPHYPGRDQKAELDAFLVQGGGPTATALVTLARLGVPTAFVGRVGADEAGARIREELLAEGVDCTGLLVDAAGTSQRAFIAVDGDGGRTIFWHRGSARPLSAGEVDADQVSCAALLHLDGLQAEASLHAARIARAHGVPTVLDGGSVRDGTLELLPWIDHPVVSEKFARQLGSSDPADVLPRLLEFGAVAATVTCGAAGSLTLGADGARFRMPAFPVAADDTTGCGDVFHGGYLYGLLMRWPLPETVRFAAACAGIKARALGGRTAIPVLADVRAFLQEHAEVQPEPLPVP